MALVDEEYVPATPVQPSVELLSPPEPLNIASAGDFNPYDPAQITDGAVAGGYEGYTPETIEAQNIGEYEGYDPANVDVALTGEYIPYEVGTVESGTGQGAAVTGDIDVENTVESRLSGLLSRSSDYMRRAETKADQQVNRRGLLNSSIAVGASQAAAIDAALPIAQQDSSQAAGLQLANLGYENTMAQLNAQQELALEQFNTGQINEAAYNNAMADIENQRFNVEQANAVNTFNVGETNRGAQFNLTMEQQTNLANADLANTANLANIAAINTAQETAARIQTEVDMFNAGLEQEVDLTNTAAINEAARTAALAEQENEQFNAGIEHETNITEAQLQQEVELSNAAALNASNMQFATDLNANNFAILSANLQAQLAEIDAELATSLAEIEHQFNIEENLDSINGAVYQQLVSGISSILSTQEDPTAAASMIEILLSASGSQYAYTTTDGTLIGTIGDPVFTTPYDGLTTTQLFDQLDYFEAIEFMENNPAWLEQAKALERTESTSLPTLEGGGTYKPMPTTK